MISAVNLLETQIVLYRRLGAGGLVALDAFLLKSDLQVAAVTAGTVDLAFDAFRRFAKGGGHPAQLNFGDCFAYALARERDCPLLFTGQDFSNTDIRPAS